MGAGCLAFRLIASAARLRTSTAHAQAVEEKRLLDARQKASTELEFANHVRLYLESRRIIPLAWGVFQPHLILPAAAVGWDDQRLHAVILHELAHIRRHDLLVLLLSRIVCALYWFNPLVWLAAWRLRIECERACDDLVLKAGVKPSDYAEQLLQISSEHESTRWLGGLAMALPGRLEARVLAVLDGNVTRSGVPRRFGVAISVLGLALLVPLAMLRVAKADGPNSGITNVKLPLASESTKSDSARAGMLSGQGERVPPYEVDGSISSVDQRDATGFASGPVPA